MSIEYRNDNFKIITEQQFTQNNFWGFKDFLDNGKPKIREQYKSGILKEIWYYKTPNENNEQIVQKYKDISRLEIISIRERESYGDFWIDEEKKFLVESNMFLQWNTRELFNNKNQLIATETIDQSLPISDKDHYHLSKSYYSSDDGMYGEYFDSLYVSEIFSGIEYFKFGIETDDQDVEIYDSIYAEQLMIRMEISPKMRAWYVNNEFLPEL